MYTENIKISLFNPFSLFNFAAKTHFFYLRLFYLKNYYLKNYLYKLLI